jgi:hypothetical protein
MSKHYHTRISEIWIDDENIMRIVFDKDVNIARKDMADAFDLYHNDMGLGPGKKKIRQMLSGGPFALTKEAREVAEQKGRDFITAAAMVTDSTLTRVVINTFNAVAKHDVPFKLFSTEEEALTWLKKFPNESNQQLRPLERA